MPVINTHGQEIAEDWVYPEAEAALGPHVILPLAELPAGPLAKPAGVWLGSAATAESVAARLGELDLVAVEFPKFRDGRGFTLARNLREKYGFKGDIRAVGHFLPDQFAALVSCGFSSMRTPAEHPPAQWAAQHDAQPGQLLRRMVARALES